MVALADLLDDAPPFARSGELVELADDAPTLHVYVRDLAQRCAHRQWRDPGAEEWADVMIQLAGPVDRPVASVSGEARQREMRVRLNSLRRVHCSRSMARSRSSTRPRSMKRTNTASSPSM